MVRGGGPLLELSRRGSKTGQRESRGKRRFLNLGHELKKREISVPPRKRAFGWKISTENENGMSR